ncbi:MAG: STAS/SEC14 domain-containing protein [Gammaproteobacteria bacterium]|nr:STAS/SEC14 domain-containing protein [Gammaproteobacteria bacterium]
MDIVKEYKFGYCTVQQRDDNILAFEIQDGIEVDAAMVDELIHVADTAIRGPFGILSNRIHSYSLSFAAMDALAHYDRMSALAIVVHHSRTRMLVETQNYFISALSKKPIKVFLDTDAAIRWLHERLHELPTDTSGNRQ